MLTRFIGREHTNQPEQTASAGNEILQQISAAVG